MSEHQPDRAPESGAEDLHHYRAFILDAAGQVLCTAALVAQDDDEAASLAGALVEGCAVELWDGLRFIEHFESAIASD